MTFVFDLASRMGDELDPTHLDRSIAGQATLLNEPRGLSVSRELVFVADPGAGDIKVFGTLAGGNVAPYFVIDDLGGAAAVEDVLFVPRGNVLYAAASDGRVLAYDDVLTNRGAGGPTRTLSFGATHATALAGGYPTLFVADMGEPGVADGAIYRLDDIVLSQCDRSSAPSVRGKARLLRAWHAPARREEWWYFAPGRPMSRAV